MSPNAEQALRALSVEPAERVRLIGAEIVAARRYMIELNRLQMRPAADPETLVRRCAACTRLFAVDDRPVRRFCSRRCCTYWHRENDRQVKEDQFHDAAA